ncbi:MAG: hypothetical protein ACK4Z9_03740 [Thermodesulfovibrionales bacterium]
MEGRVEIRKDGSGSIRYAFVTDPSLAEAFKQSKCFTRGERIRSYIREGRFYHEGTLTFSSLDGLNIKDERLSISGIRYEHVIFPEKQQRSEEDKALSVLLLRGHFFTYNLSLPETIKAAYPVEINGIEIERLKVKGKTASWKIPLDLVVSAEKEVIFKVDMTKPFDPTIPKNQDMGLVLPFGSGESYFICQGYNNKYITHHDLDKYSFDFTVGKGGGKGCIDEKGTSGKEILSPLNGVIAWHDSGDDDGILCINNLEGNRSIKIGHMQFERAWKSGDKVQKNQVLGIVAGPNEWNTQPNGKIVKIKNGGIAHIHIGVFDSKDCAIRPIPFDTEKGTAFHGCIAENELNGICSFPADESFNQYAGKEGRRLTRVARDSAKEIMLLSYRLSKSVKP